MDKQILDEHNKIFLDSYDQVYQGLFLHPEAGEDPGLNESFDNIAKDLTDINNLLKNTGNAVNDLLINTTLRLDEVRNSILLEKERLQDVQMLCNKYTDFDNVKTIDNINFSGDYTIEKDTYYASLKKSKEIELRVLDVYGNGYEGNEFVYNNYEYQKNTYDTSLHNNMIDHRLSTYYEYSRLTVQNKSDITNSYFNRDSEYAKCTISFQSNDIVNFIDISTEDLGVEIIEIQTSLDGIKYTSVPLSNKIILNNKLESYTNYGYVYGSGFINVPSCLYFKLTFTTDRNKDDVIAYQKNVDVHEESYIQDFGSTQTKDWDSGHAVNVFAIKQDTIVESARRSAIKINDIKAYRKVYKEKTIIKSSELINEEAYSVAVFANVYVPSGLQNTSVKFYITINGTDHEVVPINSHSNGIKILRFSGGKSSTLYTELLSEKIVSAYLTIVYENYADMTPMVNNVKLLIGGEI